MEPTVRIKGLKEAMRAMEKAFPKNADKARSLLNQTMSGAARKSILPIAKANALIGDGSGALSESLAMRAVGKSRVRRKGAAASVQVTPVRYNPKAIAMYTAHYYAGQKMQIGRLKLDRVAEGIRHGHLVEFGTRHHGAFPFLYPALKSGRSGYIKFFAATLERKIAAAVRHEARKRAKAK